MWKDSFNIGIPAMDMEHNKLIGIIEAVNRLISEGKEGLDCYDALRSTLKELERYTREHFRDEEALLVLKSYTKLEAHKGLHDDFLARLHKLIGDDVNYDQLHALEVVVQQVFEWLVEHILTEDQKYLAVMM